MATTEILTVAKELLTAMGFGSQAELAIVHIILWLITSWGALFLHLILDEPHLIPELK
ncbi:hypothetical protein HWQ67_18090, partial [Candidatus Magnetobacterium casensis]|nr:hypothetical protein [Candidatus Magnetobacterium casensis]